MVRYKFLIVEEERLKISNASVLALIQKYKIHGTTYLLSSWICLTDSSMDHSRVMQFTPVIGNVRLCINDYVIRELPITVNG